MSGRRDRVCRPPKSSGCSLVNYQVTPLCYLSIRKSPSSRNLVSRMRGCCTHDNFGFEIPPKVATVVIVFVDCGTGASVDRISNLRPRPNFSFTLFRLFAQSQTCTLLAALNDIGNFMTCSNWNGLYGTSVTLKTTVFCSVLSSVSDSFTVLTPCGFLTPAVIMYNSVCYDATTGFSWIATTQFCIVFFSMIMLTLRVGFTDIKSEQDQLESRQRCMAKCCCCFKPCKRKTEDSQDDLRT